MWQDTLKRIRTDLQSLTTDELRDVRNQVDPLSIRPALAFEGEIIERTLRAADVRVSSPTPPDRAD
jgi:hypothetical protein